MELFLYYFSAVDRPSLLFSLFLVFTAAALTIAHHILKRKGQSLFVWRLLCLLPLALSILHYFLYWLRGSWLHMLALYGALYLTSLLLALWQFFYNRTYSYCIAAGIINLCAVLSFITFFSIHSSFYTNVNNFTHQSYTEAFQSTVNAMKHEYVLSEWKEIDYDALEQDIMPMVEEAEKEQDKTAYGIALMNYVYRFHDGHVSLDAMDDNDMEAVCERLAGNDYGFSMAPLADGSVIAVLTDTDSKAYALGIRNGSAITKWNGLPIEKAIQDVECIYPKILTFPVAANEAYLKPVFLAGKGEEEHKVTFLDEKGMEKTVTLHPMGNYQTRLELALSRFYHSDIPDENFSCKMLTDNTGYLRISEETYITWLDSAASLKGEYPEVTEMLDEKLKRLREAGMDRLIIDLRGNVGGSAFICPAVAALFAKEPYFCSGFGKYENNTCIPLKSTIEVTANEAYADLPVAVLVNAECCSSGDSLADLLSKLPNVTLMGITSSNGVDQTIGGYCFTTDSAYIVAYPTFMSLNENGEVRIDTKSDRISRIPLKEHIALTKEAALSIFSGEGDYELDYAINYIHGR